MKLRVQGRLVDADVVGVAPGSLTPTTDGKICIEVTLNREIPLAGDIDIMYDHDDVKLGHVEQVVYDPAATTTTVILKIIN